MNNIIDCTVDENGDVLYLATEANDRFLKQPDSVTRRASHVEPHNFWLRIAFRILRTISGDKNTIAAWTRNWRCLWRVDTRPVGGPVLHYWDVPMYDWAKGCKVTKDGIILYGDRQKAIDAEIKFLNDRGIE